MAFGAQFGYVGGFGFADKPGGRIHGALYINRVAPVTVGALYARLGMSGFLPVRNGSLDPFVINFLVATDAVVFLRRLLFGGGGACGLRNFSGV
jgi:hypothetical protein